MRPGRRQFQNEFPLVRQCERHVAAHVDKEVVDGGPLGVGEEKRLVGGEEFFNEGKVARKLADEGDGAGGEDFGHAHFFNEVVEGVEDAFRRFPEKKEKL